MFRRRTTGSVVCPSCGSLVGVRDDKCYTCGRTNPGLWGFAPLLRQFGVDLGFIQIVIGGSTALYALSLLTSGRDLQIVGGGISFLVPSVEALLRFGASGYYPVYVQGAWWTVLSASWLHGSLLHILFNMMWVRQLGPVTADIIGPSRTVIVYTISGITGFLLSSSAPFIFGRLPIPFLHVAPFTVGASASIFGLLGTLVHYGRKGGSSLVGGEAMRYALLLFVFGLIMPGVDNFAHAGGFIGGYIASAVMNPLTRERGDHTLVAVACLAATFLAILFSVLQGFTLQA
jgi:membrane associated rhomboid family serine protease